MQTNQSQRAVNSDMLPAMIVIDTTYVAGLLKMKPSTVRRYIYESKPDGRYGNHPFPAPDGKIGSYFFWNSGRDQEFIEWSKTRGAAVLDQ